MKKILILLCAALSIIGCGSASGKTEYTEDRPVITGENSEECRMCKIRNMMGRKDNLALICMNTWNCSHVFAEEEDMGSCTVLMGSHGRDRCLYYETLETTRSVTDFRITYGAKSQLDKATLKEAVCSSCMEVITFALDEYTNEECPQYCSVLLDCKTGALYSIAWPSIRFYIRDYMVVLSHEEDTADLLIAYVPGK